MQGALKDAKAAARKRRLADHAAKVGPFPHFQAIPDSSRGS